MGEPDSSVVRLSSWGAPSDGGTGLRPSVPPFALDPLSGRQSGSTGHSGFATRRTPRRSDRGALWCQVFHSPALGDRAPTFDGSPLVQVKTGGLWGEGGPNRPGLLTPRY